MKTQTLCIVCLIFAFGGLKAQKKLEIDFNSKTVNKDKVESIEEGDLYQVEIKNINLNLFKVALFSKDTIISKVQQTPTFGNISFDDLSKIAANISSGSTLSSEMYQDIEKSSFSLKKTWSELPLETLKKSNKLIIEMLEHKTLLDDNKVALEALIKEIDDLKLSVYKDQLNAMRLDNPSSALDVDQMLADIEAIKRKLEQIKTAITSNKGLYDSFSTYNKTAIAADAALTANDKSIKETHDKLVTVVNEVIASVSADKTKELLLPIIFIQNNANNTYTSLPLQFTGEQTRLKLTITPRDEKYSQSVYTTQIKFPLTFKNYTVVGISLYGSNLHDRSYSFLKTAVTDSTATYSIKQETAAKAELGVAALLRYGTKFGKERKAGYHFSFGAGMSIANKVKPRVLLGGGLSVGKKHILALDMGLITGFVDRLSNSVKTESPYLEKPENIIVSKLALGAFVSLGYIFQF